MNSAKCYECGFVGWADVEFCKKCGAALIPPSADGNYQIRQGYVNDQGADRGRFHGELKKGLAIWSLVIGIFSFLTMGLLGIGATVGITLGIIALVKTNRHPSEYGGKGLAIAGLVLSSLSAIFVPVAFIAAIAIPNLMASARAANEGSTIQALRTISAAEATYYGVHGKYGTLDQLALDQLIDPDVAAGTRHGYKFKVDISTLEFPGPTGFEAIGVPVTYPSSGRRSFYINETGVIRVADKQGTDATRLDPPLDFDSGYSSGSRGSRPYSADRY
jgi:type II secretory pathway pseudopilin PulG